MSKWLFLWVLGLFAAVFVIQSAPAVALERCVVADPKDPTLNVRAEPRGKLLGRLKNGRAVYIFNQDEIDHGPGAYDRNGNYKTNYTGDYRTWSYVAGEVGGKLKPLGWVYHRHLKCTSSDVGSGEYPLMFGPEFDSAAYAHRVDGFATSGKYPNNCYYYGDGGTEISVSDAVLQSFQARGFSFASMCLGLISYGVLFDPETGERLPSYMYANLANIRKLDECMAAEERGERVSEECILLMEPGADVASDIHLLDLPDCFKGGLPYSDCAMNYDMETGRKIGEAERKFLRWQGQQIEITMKEAMQQGIVCRPGNCGEELHGHNRKGLDGYYMEETLREVKGSASPFAQQLDGFAVRSSVTVFDVSPAFPRGFGYGLGVDGAAGPSANLQSAKLALAQKDRATRAEIEALEDGSR